jgi:hypothetical protein
VKPASIVEAAVQSMLETTAQLRALRKAAEAQFFGDEEYHREAIRVATKEAQARYDAPPDPNVRKKLIPNWARRKWRIR